MKHFALIAAISAVALVGCANPVTKPTQADATPMSKPAHGHHHGHAHGKPHGYGHEHHDGHHMAYFTCDQNANVIAKYNAETEIATLKITAPTLGFDKQAVQLKHSPSASGERYVNDVNPANVYEWHAKGDMGMLSIKVDNKEYHLNCESAPFHH